MLRMKRITCLCAVLLLMATAALAAGTFELEVQPGNWKLSGDTYEIVFNDAMVVLPVQTGDWKNVQVNWVASDSRIVTVENGAVVAQEVAGTATIYATAISSSGESAVRSIKVRVVKPDPKDTTVSVRSENNVSSMKERETLQLFADVTPITVNVRWKSSNANIATVDQTGKLTGIKAGKVTVTATAQDGGNAQGNIEIRVISAATSVKINKSEVALYLGGVTAKLKKTATVSAVFTPSGTTSAVTWDSSDESVVTVTNKGKLTALKAGRSTITLSTDNGLSATCVVTVEKLPTKVQLPKRSVIRRGQSLNLLSVLKMNGTSSKLQWASANKKIAKVSKGVVTGVRPGITKIAVKAINGKGAVCLIKVKK